MSRKITPKTQLKLGMIVFAITSGFIIGFLLTGQEEKCTDGEWIEERQYCEGPPVIPSCPDGWRWSESKQRCEVLESPATTTFTIIPEQEN